MTLPTASSNKAKGTLDHAAALKWHRRLGLAAALTVVLSSLSGLLHPIMTRMQPAPAKLALDLLVPALDGALTPAQLLEATDIRVLSDLRIVSWAGRRYYQVSLPRTAERRYFGIVDGAPLADGDRKYAEYLAREFVGEPTAPVRDARIVESFDWEYPRVNRLLPVWRVEFNRTDAMRAYVDTRTGRLGTLVDRMKAWSAIEFAVLHRWQWLDPLSPILRLVVLSCFLLAAFAVTLSGCWIYLARWSVSSARWNLRRVHRLWGISISIVSFMFVLSGSFHLLHLGIRGDSGERYQGPAPEYRAADLKLTIDDAIQQTGFTAVETVSLAQIDGQTYYRVQAALETNLHKINGADHHGAHGPQGKATASQVAAPKTAAFVSTRGESILPDGAKRYAIEVAKNVTASQAAGPATLVTEFDAEYGFSYKRLPVQRIPFANDVAVFIDPADGAIAAVLDNADRAEGWVFGYIHKLEWLVPFTGMDLRDAIAMVLALLLAGAALLGLALYCQQRQRQPVKGKEGYD